MKTEFLRIILLIFIDENILLIGSSGLDWKEFLKINPTIIFD